MTAAASAAQKSPRPRATKAAGRAASDTPEFEVAVTGAGFSGLCMAIQLKLAGVDSFTVFEKAHDIGGIWRDSLYPGRACDVPSHLYSYSFEPNPNWSRMFAPQGEICAYLRRCADKYGVLPHMRFGMEIAAARYDEQRRYWTVTAADGSTVTVRIVVSSVGALSIPAYPKVPGVEKFTGSPFHSARWDRNFDFTGKRVAVIGTGASAIQFVPAVAPKVGHLDLYQRTPPWVLSTPDRAMKLAEAWAKPFIKRSIKDPKLRRKVTPDYTIGCKRILMSDEYYPALTRDNVEVITTGIREVRAHAVVTEDGVERPADAIIYGTGFQVSDPIGSDR